MAEFNDSSTGYVGNLPESRQEAKEDGVLNSYAHMYDVIKEDKYRQMAISEEVATRKSKDAVLQANITKEANAREEADKELQDKIDAISVDVNVISPLKVTSKATGTGDSGIAFGNGASTDSQYTTCVGTSANIIGGTGSSVYGYNASASAHDSVAIGRNASCSSYYGVSVGYGAATGAGGAITVGALSSASGVDAVSVGHNSKVSANSGVAIGSSAVCKNVSSVALGAGALATAERVVSVGNAYVKRRIVMVNTPTENDDAATKGYVDNLVPSTELLSYLKTLPDIEFGYSDIGTIAAGGFKTVDITFSSTKTEAPSVFANVCANADGVALVAYVKYSTTTGATLAVSNLGSSEVQNVTVDWFALSGR